MINDRISVNIQLFRGKTGALFDHPALFDHLTQPRVLLGRSVKGAG
jgi:hypothetical protein